ncbi:MAG TPA: Gfo/Idh/MocA family oxidoreductase, partial [Chloroflexota bacterium]
AGLIGRVLRVSSYYDDAADNCPYHTVSRMRFLVDADVTEVQAHAQLSEGIRPIDTGRELITEETWTQAQLQFENGVLGSCTYVTYWTRPLRTGHPRFTSVEGTEGFVVSGLWSPNMLRRVEDGRAMDYPLQVETHAVDGADVPTRFFFETDPPVEFQNPFANRALPLGSGWEGLARAHELESLYRAVTEGAEPAYSVERARRDQELAILLTESAEQREPLRAQSAGGADTRWEATKNEEFRRRYGVDLL